MNVWQFLTCKLSYVKISQHPSSASLFFTYENWAAKIIVSNTTSNVTLCPDLEETAVRMHARRGRREGRGGGSSVHYHRIYSRLAWTSDSPAPSAGLRSTAPQPSHVVLGLKLESSECLGEHRTQRDESPVLYFQIEDCFHTCRQYFSTPTIMFNDNFRVWAQTLDNSFCGQNSQGQSLQGTS